MPLGQDLRKTVICFRCISFLFFEIGKFSQTFCNITIIFKAVETFPSVEKNSRRFKDSKIQNKLILAFQKGSQGETFIFYYLKCKSD